VSALTACLVYALLTPDTASSSHKATESSQRMTLYSVAVAEQFMNTHDDRQRGVGSNPFGNFNDVTRTATPKNNLPSPGDYALLKFNVYGNASLKKRVGSAVFTCQYAFNQRALCNATYELSDGTLNGIGVVNFNVPNFELVITGGTRQYFGLRGDMASTPAAHGKAQQIVFVLS
jgi:hypothetical protein